MTLTLAEALSELPALFKEPKPLRPSYLDPAEWRPGGRLARQAEPPGWRGIRAAILARDGGCVYCAHLPASSARDHLEVNHLNGFRDNRPEALETVCVLCHRVLHAGRSSAIHGSLLLFRCAAVDQNTMIRLSWHMRERHKLRDRPLMSLLALEEPQPFRMDREYLATLVGYVVEQYWLLERSRF